jgi:hypothetical protein
VFNVRILPIKSGLYSVSVTETRRLLDTCFEVAQPVLPIKRALTPGEGNFFHFGTVRASPREVTSTT